MALSDHKIVKRNDVSDGENLTKALKDEGFNLPPSALHQEKSTVLMKKCNPMNLRPTKAPQITFYAKSLLSNEQEVLGEFLIDRKRNFAWSYANILGLDPEVVVHHLAIYPGTKPIQ